MCVGVRHGQLQVYYNLRTSREYDQCSVCLLPCSSLRVVVSTIPLMPSSKIMCLYSVANSSYYFSWVFMDGIWTLSMAFSLPLAQAATLLSKFRPTASILGPHTLSSACGILAINFLFLASSLFLLWQQEWFTCRRWDSTDVSDVRIIGDNYESSVIFCVVGYQYISSAAAFNFGYSFRSNWFRNYVFVFFFLLWTAVQFSATLTASKLSCIWRLNCDNEHADRFVTIPYPVPIHNIYNTTVMPVEFRGKLVALMVVNLILNCAWDYFVVNWRYVRSNNKN